MPDRSTSRGVGPTSVSRALTILEMLASTHEGNTFTELQEHLRIPKSSLHELLALLVARRYVSLTPGSRRYILGLKAFEVGQSYSHHHDLLREAVPRMRKLVDRMNETTQLAVLDGAENVYLAKVDCTHPLRIQTEAGRRFPAHASALGKVLLAHLEPADLDAAIGRVGFGRLTEHTLTTEAALRSELEITKARGFGVDWEEGTPGLICIATPIYQRSRVVAAVSVSIPTQRVSQDRLVKALRLLTQLAIETATSLGTTDVPPLARLIGLGDAELLEQIDQHSLVPAAERLASVRPEV